MSSMGLCAASHTPPSSRQSWKKEGCPPWEFTPPFSMTPLRLVLAFPRVLSTIDTQNVHFWSMSRPLTS